MRWSKNANQTGRIANRVRKFPRWRRQHADRLIRFDAHRTHGLHSVHNLQAKGAGKAVRLGRGPATVIG
jgi:hypothetical protein